MTAKDWLEMIPEEYRKYAREFAIMKCAEQRENCYQQYIGTYYEVFPVNAEHIRTAPEPEFD